MGFFLENGYGFYFSKTLRLLARSKWMFPYLLIPPTLALLVYTEGFLAAEGIAGVYTIYQRSILALWNISFLFSLITGMTSCLFFSNFWGDSQFLGLLSQYSKKFSGYWSPVFAFLSVSIIMYSLSSMLIVLLLPGAEFLPWMRIAAIFYAPVLWSSCIGAFLGLLTKGGAGSFFFVVFFLFSFFVGMSPLLSSFARIMAIIIPPVGLIMKETFVNSGTGYLFSIILIIHCLIILGIGRILFAIGLKRS